MPDLTITPAQVLPGSGASLETRIAAVAITAGQVVYKNASNQWGLAQCDGTDLEVTAAGIALNAAGVGQPVQAVTAGIITLGVGAAPVVAQLYCVSVTPGGIGLYSELVSTNKVTILGYGMAANQLRVQIIPTGLTKP